MHNNLARQRVIAILRRFVLIAPLSVAVTACVQDPQVPATSSVALGASPYIGGELSTLTYRAVDLMMAAAPQVGAATPLVVASIADTENLEASSALGNIVADMIRTRLAQTGHSASEMRLRSTVFFKKKDGEFLLSRDRHALMPAPVAAAAVAGTYAASYGRVYVSLKLISTGDSRIITGADFVVPRQDVEGLLERPVF